MADIDILALIESIVDARLTREAASFTDHTYGSQPILQTGRQLQRRQEADARRREREAVRETQRVQGRQKRRQRRRDGAYGQPGGYGDDGGPVWMRELDLRASDDGAGPVPARYKEMRALARGRGGYQSMTSPRLFFEQARFMEDFEDDCPTQVDFSHYYPTYAVMDMAQLRSYFSWRSRLRHGEFVPAPVSFAFLHAYELLCGVGTRAGRQGYHDLLDFWKGFSPYATGTSFDSLLRRWVHDYAIYHGMPELLHAPAGDGGGDGAVASTVASGTSPVTPEGMGTSAVVRPVPAFTHGDAIVTLIDAEGAVLARAGRTRKVAPPPDALNVPTRDAVFDALAKVSRYRIERSRFAKDHRDDLTAIVETVFAEMVLHCSKRRKTDFVEGLFGYPREEPYVMYPSAVFFDPEPPADGTVVRLGRGEVYRCDQGRWSRRLAYRRDETSRELGVILRAVDSRARGLYGYGHPIKVLKEPPAYVGRIIDRAISARVEERRKLEARRITIDLSKLGGIRETAAVTREALLVDEERDDVGATSTNIFTGDMTVSTNVQNKMTRVIDNNELKAKNSGIIETDVVGSSEKGILDAVECDFMLALLDGDAKLATDVVARDGKMMSMLVDSINEKLFDIMGDTIIEFDGDAPMLVADYEEDVRKVVDDG